MMDIVMMETTMLIATLMEAIAVTIMLQIGITIAQFVSVLKVKQVSITLFLGVISIKLPLYY